MNFTFEISRVLRSKFVLGLLLAILILTPLVAFETTQSSLSNGISSVPPISVQSGYYQSEGNFILANYVYNQYGEPISSVHVEAYYDNNHLINTTGESGYANFTIPISQAINGSLLVRLTFYYAPISYNLTEFSILNVFAGASGFSIRTIVNPENTSRLGLYVFYTGQGNSRSPEFNLSIYGISPQENMVSSSSVNSSDLEFSSNYSGVYKIKIFPNLNASDLEKSHEVIITSTNNISQFYIGPLLTNPATSQDQFKLGAITLTITPLLFFIPLLGIFGGYFTYGKDKVTGILESILKRPITARKLLISRYLAMFLVLIIGSLVSSLVTYLIYARDGLNFGLTDIIILFLSVATTGVIYLSVSYFFSSFSKSQGSLLISLILFYIITGILYDVIIFSLLIFGGGQPGTIEYYKEYVVISYIFPTQLPTLVLDYVFSTFTLGVSGIVPSAIGILPQYIILDAVLWILIPLLPAIWKSERI